MDWPSRDVDPPEPTRLGEASWLEPYPDLLLAELPDDAPGPQARYEAREAISLAFVTALQLLPPRQRAALILRDVLGFATAEAAEILQASEQSVASAVSAPGPPWPASCRRPGSGRHRRPRGPPPSSGWWPG